MLGWEIGLANAAIFLVAGNLLNMPLEQLVQRFFPQARYRSSLSPEAQIKLARFGRRVGLNKRDL